MEVYKTLKKSSHLLAIISEYCALAEKDLHLSTPATIALSEMIEETREELQMLLRAGEF